MPSPCMVTNAQLSFLQLPLLSFQIPLQVGKKAQEHTLVKAVTMAFAPPSVTCIE